MFECYMDGLLHTTRAEPICVAFLNTSNLVIVHSSFKEKSRVFI